METPGLIARLQQGDYGDTATKIIALAKAAAEVHADFRSQESRVQWLSCAGIHPDTWAKLISIAHAKYLNDAEVVRMLPPNFSTLSLLSRCSEAEFKQALAQNLISPKLTHRALSTWRKEQESQQPNRKPVLRLLPVVIALDPQADACDELAIQIAIQAAIDDLTIDGELIQLKGWEDIDEQALHQWRRARLQQALEQVNHQISPQILTMADLSNPIGQLKDMCASLHQEQWIKVYTLKHAHDTIYAPTKQKRYASRIRIQREADGGDELAGALTRTLLGAIPVQAELFDQISE
jgi:hypothetical protein